MSQETYSLKRALKNHLDFICENSSCHGGNWALKTPSRWLKSIIQLGLFFLQIFLFLVVVAPFFVDKSIHSSTRWERNDESYPNITICNSRMFSKAKMKGLYLISMYHSFIFCVLYSIF